MGAAMFAIFYNDLDLLRIERALQGTSYEGSLGNWAKAPVEQSPFEGYIATNTARRVVIEGSLQEMRDVLYAAGLRDIADDMGRNCGAVEPWPVM